MAAASSAENGDRYRYQTQVVKELSGRFNILTAFGNSGSPSFVPAETL